MLTLPCFTKSLQGRRQTIEDTFKSKIDFTSVERFDRGHDPSCRSNSRRRSSGEYDSQNSSTCENPRGGGPRRPSLASPVKGAGRKVLFCDSEADDGTIYIIGTNHAGRTMKPFPLKILSSEILLGVEGINTDVFGIFSNCRDSERENVEYCYNYIQSILSGLKTDQENLELVFENLKTKMMRLNLDPKSVDMGIIWNDKSEEHLRIAKTNDSIKVVVISKGKGKRMSTKEIVPKTKSSSMQYTEYPISFSDDLYAIIANNAFWSGFQNNLLDVLSSQELLSESFTTDMIATKLTSAWMSVSREVSGDASIIVIKI